MSKFRRTKIVATLGPASSAPERIRELMEAGVDVFRVNFSHGTADVHRTNVQRVREAADELGRTVGVLQDLQGPKIRVGKFADGQVALVPGEPFALTCADDAPGDAARVGVTYKGLCRDVKPGDALLLDDGRLALRVTTIERATVHTEVTLGGVLSDSKGINLPDADLSIPALTDKDVEDLKLGAEIGVDWVAMSFVRSRDDLLLARHYLAREGSSAKLMAKIEKPGAVERFPEILREVDGIMVARGDLGVEMDLARVPVIQKDLIRRAAEAAVPVITATEMLQSMVTQPRPTRAEVSDVAGAVFDGSDAVMLSGETAVGRYPVRAVETMDHVIDVSEDWAQRADWPGGAAGAARYVWTERAVVAGAAGIARDLDVRLIVALTHSGATALLMSKQGLRVPILAVSDSLATCRRMALYRGVIPVHRPELIRHEALAEAVERMALERKLVVPGEPMLIMCGYLPGRPGTTDTLRVHTVSEAEQEEPS